MITYNCQILILSIITKTLRLERQRYMCILKSVFWGLSLLNTAYLRNKAKLIYFLEIKTDPSFPKLSIYYLKQYKNLFRQTLFLHAGVYCIAFHRLFNT